MRQPTSAALKLTLLLTSTLTVMAGATIAPSLPAMQAAFAELPNAAFLTRLVLTMPALFIVLGAPLAGAVVDRFGRKPLLLGALVLYALSGSSGFLLASLEGILVSRALLGLAVAGITITATTLIADYFTGTARSQFLGLQAMFMSLGGVLFVSLGGVAADISWRLPFLIYLAALIVLPLALRFLYEPKREDPGPSATPLEEPKLPTRLMGFLYGTALLGMIAFYMIPVLLPFYLQALTGASATQSGFALATATLTGALTSLLYGRLRSRLSFAGLMAASFGLMGVGYGVIGFAGSFVPVIAGLAVAGLGLGLFLPNLNNWLTAEVPAALRGRALGGLTTSIFLGQFLSPIVSQPVIGWLGYGPTYALAGGLLASFALLIVLGSRQIGVVQVRPAPRL